MAEKILASDNSSTASSLNPPSRIICHVCQKQFSQYTCPRCNSRYCSLHCYKSHSLRCTESFMRENVVEELRQMQPDEETKHKMLGILKRFHLEEEMDHMTEEDSTLSEETIQKILTGGDLVFDDLSEEEKKQFLRAVASGELSKMIEPWEPWWSRPSAKSISLSSEGTRLVQLLPEQDTSSLPHEDVDMVTSQSNEIPPGPETPLPPLSQLSSTQPSPLLAIHLVDIIYNYCFVLLLYNGDWQSDALGSAMVVLSMSSVLGQNGHPETVFEALCYCLEQTCSPSYRHMGGSKFGLSLVNDVVTILSLGGDALVCALCDLQRMIQSAEKELKLEKPKKLISSEIRVKLKLAERKIYYIMCWVHEQPGEGWGSLASIVRMEKTSVVEDEGGPKVSAKEDSEAGSKGKVLIQELE